MLPKATTELMIERMVSEGLIKFAWGKLRITQAMSRTETMRRSRPPRRSFLSVCAPGRRA